MQLTAQEFVYVTVKKHNVYANAFRPHVVYRNVLGVSLHTVYMCVQYTCETGGAELHFAHTTRTIDYTLKGETRRNITLSLTYSIRVEDSGRFPYREQTGSPFEGRRRRPVRIFLSVRRYPFYGIGKKIKPIISINTRECAIDMSGHRFITYVSRRGLEQCARHDTFCVVYEFGDRYTSDDDVVFGS